MHTRIGRISWRPRFFQSTSRFTYIKKYAHEIYRQIQEKKLPPKVNVKIIEGEETTHFSILDKWGNAVSNTYTLNTAYGQE